MTHTMHAAALCLLLACTSSRIEERHAEVKLQERDTARQVIEQGPTRTVEVDEYEEEPAPVEKPKAVGPEAPQQGPAEPAAHRPAPRLLRRTITTEQLPIGPAGPALLIRDSERHDVQAAATVQTHTESKTAPALGFQLWLVLIPAALIGAGLLAWRFKWI